MPTPAYMWLKDDTGADILGSVQIGGREGSVEIQQFDHDLEIPTDTHSGRLRGIRIHRPVKIIKEFDSSSPYLYQTCCEGKTLTEVKISWFQIDDTGTEVEYFTHLLEGAKITEIKAHMPSTKDEEKKRYGHLEEVSFVYNKITWTFQDGALEYTDEWIAAK